MDVQYVGTRFGGWVNTYARSGLGGNNLPGVSDALGKAFGMFAGSENVKNLRGSSRTDAGVHAICNRFHVDLSRRKKDEGKSPYDAMLVQKAVNFYLNSDVLRITGSRIVDPSFDAVRSAKSRTYMYRIMCPEKYGQFMWRFQLDRLWQAEHPLNVDLMREAAQSFVGTKDFTAVRNAGCLCSTPVRTVEYLTITDHRVGALGDSDFDSGFAESSLLGPGKLITITIKANAFVYRMVRNIVGALVEVGKGKLHPGDLNTLLENKNRHFLPRPAPACGLYLLHVGYDEEKEWNNKPS
jgi:tRNA pseudouridine38-40 synthase